MHGDEHSDCAGAYAEYAKALLRKVQSEGDPFGSAGPKPEAKSAPTGEGEAGPSSGTAEDAAAGDEATGEGEGGGDEEEGGDDDDAEEGDGEASDEADDLELAFQCFEVARLAYEKMPGAELSLDLAEVLECIGEVHMENEHWTPAVSEFASSLSIKEKKLPAGDRQLAHLHFLMAQASASHMEDLLRDPDADRGGDPADASSSSAITPEATREAADAQRKEAIRHYEACAKVFELRLELLTQSAAPAADAAAAAPSESDDLKELLAEVLEKAKELEGAATTAAAQAAKAAGAAAGSAAAAAASDGAAATTPSGFDAPRCGISAAGVTTVGFGAGASAGGGAGFGGSATAGKASAAPVQIIAGRKKAVLVPLSTNQSGGGAAAAPTKAAREAEPAEGAEAKKARLQ